MTTVTIGDSQTNVAQASASWIRDHVRALRSRDMRVCVQVSIHAGAVNVLLSTPACSTNATSREPNAEERKIVDLWRNRGMDSDDFDIGQLIAFVNEIKHV